jgi:cytochrome bd ubiquinol oxidase subunit II
VSLADLAAALVFLGVIAYALFGGADFGSGVWDLSAGDARRGAPVRNLIDTSIGPVWEANHVWLIYVLVFLWTAFPVAFGALMTTLFVPWLLVGLGIVLRGSGFAFRKYAEDLDSARVYGALFAASSLVTPLFLGMIAGAIASGRVPVEGGDLWTSWTGPTSWVGGILAVLTCAFLAATFLAADARKAGQPDLAAWCGRRALATGVVTGAVALVAIVPLRADAETLAEGLQGRASPLVVLSAIAGAATLWLLWTGRYGLARFGAVAAVATIVAGWGVAQYPDLLVDQLTIEEGAGADATLWALVITFGLAAVTAVPALVWLYVLVNQTRWHREPARRLTKG